MDKSKKQKIKSIANKLRYTVIEMLYHAKSGHPGGALSSADIFATIYFGDILKVFPDDPYSYDRDIFILNYLKNLSIPVATVIGGGYSESKIELAKRHSIIFEAAQKVHL